MLTFVVKVSKGTNYDVRWTSPALAEARGNRGGANVRIHGGSPFTAAACQRTRRLTLARINTLITTCVVVNNGNLNSFRVINGE